MRIEDEELRTTFKTVSEERLQNMDAGLLRLEADPGDRAALDGLMREAHSLKGDAGMLGVKDLATLAHQWEHLLGSVREGENEFVPAVCDRLYQGLDAMRKLSGEAVTGAPSGVDTFRVLAALMGAAIDPPEAAPSPSLLPPEAPPNETLAVPATIATDSESNVDSESDAAGDREPVERPSDRTQPATPTAVSEGDRKLSPTARDANRDKETYRIETVRVSTSNLDALMTETGELTVAKTHLDRRASEIEELIAFWEEWRREASNALPNARASRHRGTDSPQHWQQNLESLQHRTEEQLERLGEFLKNFRHHASEDLSRVERVADTLAERVRTLRLLPLSAIFQLFPRAVRDLARTTGKEVRLVVEGDDTLADKHILEEMKDPIAHAIRNAIDHGIETPEEREVLGKPRQGTVWLRGRQGDRGIVIEIEDDGYGLDLQKIEQIALQRGLYREAELAAMTPEQIQALLFEPGFSTRTFVTEVSGRGVGLDVVRANVERLKGAIEISSTPGAGTLLRVRLGTTLSTARVLLANVRGNPYAIPVEYVQTTRLVAPEEVFSIEGREKILWQSQPISVVPLERLLELPERSPVLEKRAAAIPCILLQSGTNQMGVFADELLDERDIVLKPQSRLLQHVRNVAGATILGTGEVCVVLNPPELIESLRRTVRAAAKTEARSPQRKPVILIAEDSIAIRTQEKRILEGAGYEVVTAVDGLDAYQKLQARNFDALVSDVQMPNCSGLQLAERVRQNPKYGDLLIVLVTSLANEEDKRRGAEAGANAYITKGNFSQEMLLETLRRLL